MGEGGLPPCMHGQYIFQKVDKVQQYLVLLICSRLSGAKYYNTLLLCTHANVDLGADYGKHELCVYYFCNLQVTALFIPVLDE